MGRRLDRRRAPGSRPGVVPLDQLGVRQPVEPLGGAEVGDEVDAAPPLHAERGVERAQHEDAARRPVERGHVEPVELFRWGAPPSRRSSRAGPSSGSPRGRGSRRPAPAGGRWASAARSTNTSPSTRSRRPRGSAATTRRPSVREARHARRHSATPPRASREEPLDSGAEHRRPVRLGDVTERGRALAEAQPCAQPRSTHSGAREPNLGRAVSRSKIASRTPGEARSSRRSAALRFSYSLQSVLGEGAEHQPHEARLVGQRQGKRQKSTGCDRVEMAPMQVEEHP